MVIGIMLLVLALLGFWLTIRSRNWKTLLSTAGSNAVQTEAKITYLKANKIKCKLVTDVGPGSGIMNANDVMPNASGTIIKLKVHKKHLEKAKQLLENYIEVV